MVENRDRTSPYIQLTTQKEELTPLPDLDRAVLVD